MNEYDKYVEWCWANKENPRSSSDMIHFNKYNDSKTVIKTNDIHDVGCCDFALWLQDNYSTNKKQGETEPLPKGYWRKDFTNEHYSITELIAIYNRSCS